MSEDEEPVVGSSGSSEASVGPREYRDDGHNRRVLIVTEGSRGDVQPFIALALELHSKGFVCALSASAYFHDFVREHASFSQLAVSRRLLSLFYMFWLNGHCYSDETNTRHPFISSTPWKEMRERWCLQSDCERRSTKVASWTNSQ